MVAIVLESVFVAACSGCFMISFILHKWVKMARVLQDSETLSCAMSLAIFGSGKNTCIQYEFHVDLSANAGLCISVS